MLRVLDRDPHAVRLQDLLRRFRTQEQAMTCLLQQLQAELEHWHREAAFLRLAGDSVADTLLQRCRDLQADCDLLATELVHVRLAVSGAGEELAELEGRLLHAGSAGRPGELTAAMA